MSEINLSKFACTDDETEDDQGRQRIKGDIMGWMRGDDINDPNVIKPCVINERTSVIGGISRDILLDWSLA